MDHDIWIDSPSADKPHFKLEVRRIGLKPIVGIVTCDKPTGCETHFWRGRTRPHIRSGGCEACQGNNLPRWHGYISLWSPKTRDHWIQEITAAAYEGVGDALKQYGSLRGHTICVARVRPHKTAPCVSNVSQSKVPSDQLPNTPPIREVLYRLWDCARWLQQDSITEDARILHLHPGANDVEAQADAEIQPALHRNGSGRRPRRTDTLDHQVRTSDRNGESTTR